MPKLRFSGGRLVISRLSTASEPELGSVNPATIMRIVVFPEPEGPRSVRNSPLPTVRETSSTAATAP